MSALRITVGAVWVVFWLYWLISATKAKDSTPSRRSRPPGLIMIVMVVVLLRVFKPGSTAIDDVPVEAVGVVIVLAGLAFAVWARIHLGRNWGMPMTQRAEPELITSGPYRFVRHPIYSGILLGMLGTALATNLYWLIVFGVMGAYFIYSATVEERVLSATFPTTYPSYRAHTKMLIPFVL